MFSAKNNARIHPHGQTAYTTPGDYLWVCPPGVSFVSVVAVGASSAWTDAVGDNYQNGMGGGGLGWKNRIAVVPGTSYTVRVGAGGQFSGQAGGDSYFISTAVVKGGGSNGTTGGSYVGDGGGNGGNGGVGFGDRFTYYAPSGGGAGGYSGNGGVGANGATTPYANGTAGTGGAGGGGTAGYSGGGVGILGQGASGAGGVYQIGNTTHPAGYGGSGGADGYPSSGLYGAGQGGSWGAGGPSGIGGAVRIIWGDGRAFPSTNTADQT